MSADRSVRVPLAVDAQFRLAVGPVLLPLRALVLATASGPAAYGILELRLPGLWSPALALFVLATAAALGIPEREGVWIGTHVLYRQAWRVLPSVLTRGRPSTARVRIVEGALHARGTRTLARAALRWSGLRVLATVPTTATLSAGVIDLSPGGARAVLMLNGPPVSIAGDAYLSWCRAVVQWLHSLDCPAQLVTVVSHHDAAAVAEAYDARTRCWPRTPLREMERDLVTTLADSTLGLRHVVVLAPGSAGDDGIPHLSSPWRARSARDSTATDAERVLASALRTSGGFGIDVRAADRDDMAAVLGHTALGSAHAVVGEGDLHIDRMHHVVVTVIGLPAVIEVGAVVDAIQRARCPAVASLHVIPVVPDVAQRHLHKRSAMLRYSHRRGADEVESVVALQDTTDVVAALAHRDITPYRVALTVTVAHHLATGAREAAERLVAVLGAHGFRTTPVTVPGFLPALAVAPGCVPLVRSLQLTSDSVVARMLPCLGTPFGDISAPLLGISALIGTPAYHSVWKQANHNLVVVGGSGAGKSVAAKALLVRHIMEGVSAVVVDPDSEYGPVMRAVGGEYFDLGAEALNPLGSALDVGPDAAASLVLPVLSMMAGDDRGVSNGSPIRRLPDEDQGWLHGELAQFFAGRSAHAPAALMRDLVGFLQDEALPRALTDRERERCRIITARLRRFAQGARATVFDRPSTFAVGDRPIAVGLKGFAMTYGADLTPALAVLLTALMAALRARSSRMLVVVDEAHRVTADPDAGEVLGQLVRQARKHGAGVWMLSQRVEDFVHTDLGRTLAATSSSKLVLGTEDAVLDDVREVFRLSDEEVAAICPPLRGRGVLIAGSERTVVDVVPGPALLAIADTRAHGGRPATRPVVA